MLILTKVPNHENVKTFFNERARYMSSISRIINDKINVRVMLYFGIHNTSSNNIEYIIRKKLVK